MADRPIVLCAVGDVLIRRPDPVTAFTPCLDVLRAPDVLFANCEAVYATHTCRAPSASIPVLCDPANAPGFGHAGFDVLSMANNHTVDGGHDALLETIATMRAQGIATCGAGAEIEEARAPAIVERDGVRIAFLAYACVHPAGYEAREGIPGLASIRTHTVYYPSDMDAFQSGGAPESFTVVNPVDLRTVRAEIARAREAADVVIFSVHAGDGSGPALLLDYEHQLAEAAIDAGADAVLGHHHHMLRGVEVYKGRPIFFGLSHFVFDVPALESQVPPSIMARMAEHAGEFGYGPREGYPLLPMHPDARMTVAAVCWIEDGAIARFGVIPFELNPEGQPVPLALDSPGGAKVVDYLRHLNDEAGLTARYAPCELEVAGFQVLEVTAAQEHPGA